MSNYNRNQAGQGMGSKGNQAGRPAPGRTYGGGAKAATGGEGKAATPYERVTGLFPSKSGKGASVNVKEDIVIPAGSRLFLFQETDVKEGSPSFTLKYIKAENLTKNEPQT